MFSSETQKESSGHSEQVMDAGEDVFHLLYFYTESCSKCEKAETFLEQLPEYIMAEGKLSPVIWLFPDSVLIFQSY